MQCLTPLLEYHNATDPTTGAVYTEYALGLQFAATCTIPSSPGTTFGSDAVPFPSKKAARANAAKEAVQHLISIGELNPDGSVKARRKIGGGGKGPTVTVEAKGVEVKKDATYAARVNGACVSSLGFVHVLLLALPIMARSFSNRQSLWSPL